MKALMLGAGRARERQANQGLLIRVGYAKPVTELVTVDANNDTSPDVVWDLNVKPWPFEDNTFDEVHAYNIMEHLGRQGDAKAFFDEMYEVWRILKPLGHFYGCCPKMNNPWVLAEPSHTRVLLPHSFGFLNREFYKDDTWETSSSDFRGLWKGDLRFEFPLPDYSEIDWGWIMVAVKDHVPGNTLMVKDLYGTEVDKVNPSVL